MGRVKHSSFETSSKQTICNMKTMLSILCLTVACAFTATAQTAPTESYPYWTISKNVQQLQFKNKQYVPSTINTGNGNWTVSKGVQRINESPTAPSKMKTGSRPTWFISKGAARFQAENSK
jgi:hypothetical protein